MPQSFELNWDSDLKNKKEMCCKIIGYICFILSLGFLILDNMNPRTRETFFTYTSSIATYYRTNPQDPFLTKTCKIIKYIHTGDKFVIKHGDKECEQA